MSIEEFAESVRAKRFNIFVKDWLEKNYNDILRARASVILRGDADGKPVTHAYLHIFEDGKWLLWSRENKDACITIDTIRHLSCEELARGILMVIHTGGELALNG